jgi:hypothetical protein
VPVKRNGPRTQALHGKRKVGQTAVAGQVFAQQANGAGVDGIACAPHVAPGHGVCEPAALPQGTHQAAAFGIRIVAPWSCGTCWLAQACTALGQAAVVVFKKRQAQEAGIQCLGHGQLPSKRGFCLATKAW